MENFGVITDLISAWIPESAQFICVPNMNSLNTNREGWTPFTTRAIVMVCLYEEPSCHWTRTPVSVHPCHHNHHHQYQHPYHHQHYWLTYHCSCINFCKHTCCQLHFWSYIKNFKENNWPDITLLYLWTLTVYGSFLACPHGNLTRNIGLLSICH